MLSKRHESTEVDRIHFNTVTHLWVAKKTNLFNFCNPKCTHLVLVPACMSIVGLYCLRKTIQCMSNMYIYKLSGKVGIP